MRNNLVLLILVLAFCACQPGRSSSERMSGLITEYDRISARKIVENTYQAAGGEGWTRPQSLTMRGYAVFYREGQSVRHEAHNMWRVYDAAKTDAHKVDGKVRIESISNGQTMFDLSFDGQHTYTPLGQQPQSESDKRWSSNFGFGVIRHALDPGYALERLPDDLIDGRPSFMVKVSDPTGGHTIFGIAQDNHRILKVGFVTDQGWHERIYSNFYANPGDPWVQPGRVRLYYNGVKANEVIWDSYEINRDVPDCLFVLPEVAGCRE